MTILTNTRILLTGAMGGGKSTILKILVARGYMTVPEPARDILAEQRLIEAPGVPETNPELFTMLMLSRAIQNYKDRNSELTVFDRGVPDMIAYARLFGLNPLPYEKAAAAYRYAPTVFFFPGWQDIYVNDDERKIGFEGARQFGADVRQIYSELGYHLIDVPLIGISERVDFIVRRLRDLS